MPFTTTNVVTAGTEEKKKSEIMFIDTIQKTTIEMDASKCVPLTHLRLSRAQSHRQASGRDSRKHVSKTNTLPAPR